MDLGAPTPLLGLFDEPMRSWQASYEKKVAFLTSKMTWREFIVGEMCGWILVFQILRVMSYLMPLFHKCWLFVWKRFDSTREHYKFQKLSPAEQEKWLENIKPSIIKLSLLALGGVLVAPMILGIRK